MKILIIGGSRFVGPILIKKLLMHGYNLTVFNRGNFQTNYDKKITFIQGDRNFKVDIPGHFDIVIDMCAYNGEQLKNVIDWVNFDYFINFGTAASYKKTEVFPLTESSPLGDWPIWGEHNRGKVECEQLLARRKINYSTIRPVYILGEANYVNRESFIYSRILHEKKIILPGNGQAICQFIFAEEVAKILTFLAQSKPEGAFNLAGDKLLTLKGLVEVMVDIVGKKVKIEFNPLADGLNHNEDEFPFANENLICSNSKLKQMGITFLPFVKTLELQYRSFYRKAIE